LQELTAQQQEKIVELTVQQEAQKAAFEAQRVAFEAAQKQMAEMMMIMQNIGQASGVEVHFTAPAPLPAPAPTPVSMKVHFSLVLCMYVGVRAVVDFGVRAVVDVGVRAVVSCKFWKPPRAGEVLPKFLTKSNLFVFLDY
jgi:capsular polysaccharide biosynthesis protein